MSQKEWRMTAAQLETLLRCAHDEMFTHINRDIGEIIHVNTTKMRKAFMAMPGLCRFNKVPLDKETHDHCLSNCGVEEDRVKRLMERPDIYSQPVLAIMYDPKNGTDPEGLLRVDGNHRTVLLYRMGIREIGVWWTIKSIWREFLEDIPMDRDMAEEWLQTKRIDPS